jgi:hypothetical protein
VGFEQCYNGKSGVRFERGLHGSERLRTLRIRRSGIKRWHGYDGLREGRVPQKDFYQQLVSKL